MTALATPRRPARRKLQPSAHQCHIVPASASNQNDQLSKNWVYYATWSPHCKHDGRMHSRRLKLSCWAARVSLEWACDDNEVARAVISNRTACHADVDTLDGRASRECSDRCRHRARSGIRRCIPSPPRPHLRHEAALFAPAHNAPKSVESPQRATWRLGGPTADQNWRRNTYHCTSGAYHVDRSCPLLGERNLLSQ